MSASGCKRVAFIGCGHIGEPMILALLRHGFSVAVYDISKRATDKAVAAGAHWCDSPREAAEHCDILCTCLPLPEHVRQTMLAHNGSLQAMRAGSVWIDCSTTDYHNTLHIAQLAQRRHVSCVEAPVSDLSHMGVDFGNIAFFVGGDERSFRACQSFFGCTGKKAFHVGAIGRAQNVKLLTNLLFYGALVTFGEASALVHAAGVPMHWWWRSVLRSRGSSQMAIGYAPLLFDGSYDASCALLIAEKDMKLTLQMGHELRVQLALARVVNGAYEEAVTRYDRNEGELMVVRVTEDDNGVLLRIPHFYAPSPYGANKQFRHATQMHTDALGREAPLTPEWARNAPPFEPSDAQRHAVRTACEYLALVNDALYDEALALARGMQLEQRLLAQMIVWSCGASWISDFGRAQQWRPHARTLQRMAQLVLASRVTLRGFARMQRALRAHYAWRADE